MKNKKLMISICVVCIVLVRIFTPYLGKPFLIYCSDQNGDEGFHMSGNVKGMFVYSENEPCIKFIRYCPELEKIDFVGPFSKSLNLNDVSNPNLKKLHLGGKCDNWSSLNKCTGLKELRIGYFSGFTTIEDISGLKELETLAIDGGRELSLNKLNELKNIKELRIYCGDDIDCEDFSQLEKLETLEISTCEKISGLDKMDTVKSLTLHQSDPEIGNDICGMDSLEEVTVDARFSEEVESALREKGVSINY